MAGNDQRRGRFSSPPKTVESKANPSSPSENSPFESGVGQVRGLLAGNHSKAAVEIAKDLHKRHMTSNSERLLVEAYQARIRDLLKQGMSIEAKSLLDLVGSRFPSARQQLQEIEWDVRARTTDLAELVAPLHDPNLSVQVRERIESVIRQRVDDIPALAQVSSLPPTHPLREAAKAVSEAFQAVTSGVVEDDILRLPQVSRRSPLASWKALIQAIASFYRGEEDTSRKWLEAIAADSVPARLILPMEAMLGQARGAVTSPAAIQLIRSVGSGARIMKAALASVEEAMRSTDRKFVLDRAREVLATCRQWHPELVERLRQHILIRLMLLGFHADQVHAALGRPREDAYWRRLLARGLEEMDAAGEARFRSVQCWEYFRDQAIRERWFAVNSLEDGLLSMRMARIVSRLPWDLVEDLLEDEPAESGRPGRDGTLPTHALLDAGNLFARACRADPHPEVFAEWLAWAKREDHDPDEVAELWRRTREQDVAPLLWLVESAERRGAYHKSLKFLEQAEQLDGLNPEVRKVRIRLLVAAVLRHFRQRKPHLAAQGIDRIAALPESQEPTVAPAIAALRSVCCAIDGDTAGAAAHRAALETQLGESIFVLLQGVADGAGVAFADAGLEGAKVTSFAEPGALASLARTCMVGDVLGVDSALPAKWESGLSTALGTPAHGLDAAQLLVIGEAALRGNLLALAYRVSAAGMKKGAADARFLFLRGRALPFWESERSHSCLRAALELARRDREMELAGRVLDHLRDFENDEYSMQADLLKKIVEEERASDSYPEQRKAQERNPSQSRRGRRHRFDADEETEDIDELASILLNAPPEIREQVFAAMRRGESTADILLRLVREHALPTTAGGARKERPPKLPPPGQGSLF
ncbi:MAG: hypothetical protein QOK38_1236 [Acidobacteriaceae bacterium]|nr:hypothetical protein [Acidobacteriaceae bacterium]